MEVTKMKHLVFVDDNPDFLDLISQDLEGEKYQVSTVLDQEGKDLVSEISELKPDLLFLDIYLQSTPIKDLCTELKRTDTTKDIPLYLVSYTEKSEIERIASEVGAKKALSKPIRRETIQEILLNIDKN